MEQQNQKPVIAKCIMVDSANKYLPVPLELNKPYVIVEQNIGTNGHYVKVKNKSVINIFHKSHFDLKNGKT